MESKSSGKSDIEIAQKTPLEPIQKIASKLGLSAADLIPYGDYMAKIKNESIEKTLSSKSNDGKLILVSAITPTDAGEGKTTCSIGLTQALNFIGKKAIVALREPSLGPCLGKKGGAAGGGYSQVLPMEEINLHFTGDFHAVTAAHNLIAAVLDNHFHFGNKRGVMSRRVLWRRVMDMNDRALREVVIGLGGKTNSIPRETGFDISAASEIMAILCLSLNYQELKEKIGNVLLALDSHGKPFTAKDLCVEGAAAALLKNAMLPNLVQTTENGPAFIHGGPFANIAQGASSILATKLGLKLSDYVVTEAGFGFDLGAEKFFDIVCPYGKFSPSAVVLVATARALKLHGGIGANELTKSSPEGVMKGASNLKKHIENVKKYDRPAIIAINRFPSDTEAELKVIQEICHSEGVESAIVNVQAEGGKGGKELAEKVVALAETSVKKHKTLFDWNQSVEEKISLVSKEIYGAKGVTYTVAAQADLRMIKEHGYDKLPVCIAKTQKSLSDNPKLLGLPKDFLVTVREIGISSGAGFLVPLTGDMLRMPGLPEKPSAEKIDISKDGKISGLF